MNDTQQRPVPLKPLTREQLLARRKTGHREAGLVESDAMRALEQALDAIHEQEGQPPVNSPVERPMFGTDKVSHKVTYGTILFGSVTIELSQIGIGNRHQLDRFTMVVPLLLAGYPDSVSFTVKQELADGVRLYRAQMGPVTDCTEEENITVSFPVRWVPGGPTGKMPETIKGKRDVDLVFLDTKGNVDGRQGAFIQLEISLSTRDGRFFLSFQQVYAGQVVCTTPANAEKTKRHTIQVGSHLATEVPLFPENSYPDTDGSVFFKHFGYLAPSFVSAAVGRGASVPLSKCVIARWKQAISEVPKHLESDPEWTVATMMWFNPVVGYGFAYCEDGKSCFVYFKTIQDSKGQPMWRNGAFPHLTPMTAVAVKIEEDPEGKRKALAVRVI